MDRADFWVFVNGSNGRGLKVVIYVFLKWHKSFTVTESCDHHTRLYLAYHRVKIM
jgi:hypothetical protein